MDFYYAVFKQTDEAIEISFPDVKNAVTFAHSMDDAFFMAADALGAALAFETVRPKRTPYGELENDTDGVLVPIHVDEKIVQTYEPTKRVNVCFSTSVLEKIDTYRVQHSLNRSEFLANAAQEFIDNHP